MERERDLCLESRFLGSTLLLDSSETLIKSSKLSSLGFLIWKMKGLDGTSGLQTDPWSSDGFPGITH